MAPRAFVRNRGCDPRGSRWGAVPREGRFPCSLGAPDLSKIQSSSRRRFLRAGRDAWGFRMGRGCSGEGFGV